MVLNYNFILKKDNVLILLCIFNAIDANTVIDSSEYLSRNKIHCIDKATNVDKRKVTENVYGKVNQTEDAEVDQNYTSYDYDHLVNEYFSDDNEVIGWNLTTTYDAENGLASNRSDEEQSTSWKSIRFSLYEVWSRKQRIIRCRLWKIIKVWFVVYLVFAVPLWCNRGWCCCCLFCKFFKPTQTIDEAKRFLEANPPGVLQEKKGGVIFYEPTSNERECYEKFGHLIRTI